MERTRRSLHCAGVDSVVGNLRPFAPVADARDREAAEDRDRAGRLTLDVRDSRRIRPVGARRGGRGRSSRKRPRTVSAALGVLRCSRPARGGAASSDFSSRVPAFLSPRAVRHDGRSASLELPERLPPAVRGSPRRRSLRTVALLPHRVRRHCHQDHDAENETAHGNPHYLCGRLAGLLQAYSYLRHPKQRLLPLRREGPSSVGLSAGEPKTTRYVSGGDGDCECQHDQ